MNPVMPADPRGSVYLVGAGPGEPELLTLKARQLIEKADVIIYDQLISQDILRSARQECELVFVGKSPGKHYRLQEEINELLVSKAQEGGIVVRLKGGDPFVFGRGGEEALALSKAQIAFEIVPGVSSALAVPAYAGVPVTHRGLSSCFTVITGHEDPTKLESSIAWEHLAQTGGTLVFLMGMANLPFITDKLVESGMDATTPVAVIQNGTSTRQRTVSGELATIASLAKQQGLSNPAVIVVGQVVRLREEIQWFEQRPLFGQSILVTRARQQSSKLTTALVDLGARVHELPVIAFDAPTDPEQLSRAIRELETFTWLIFTSVNGVEAFFVGLSAEDVDIRALAGLKIAAIGPATQKALMGRGLRNITLPQDYDAEGLAEKLEGSIQAGERVLLVRPEQARYTLGASLQDKGAVVSEVAAYKTVSASADTEALVDSLRAGDYDAITFTSSSTVRNLMQMISGDTSLLEGVRLCSIGPITSDTLRAYQLEPTVEASDYCLEGLVEAMVRSG